MLVKVDCPHCGVRLRVGSSDLGTPVRCAGCHHVFTPQEEAHDGAPVPRTRRRQAPAPRPPLLRTEGVGVPTLLTGLGSLGLTVLLAFLVFGAAPHSALARLFSHGWVSFMTAWFTVWALVILGFKLRRLAQEKAALKFDPLSQDAEEGIRPDNVEVVLEHIDRLPHRLRNSLLFRRIARALQYFRSSGSRKGVSDYLTLQAELDVAASDSSYAMVKVLIWAIPILGFIGTVIGIGAAVDSFAVSVDAATEVEAIRTSLGGVTSGLGTAFETTLVALVMSIVLMIPTNWLQKTEDELLTAVAGYGNEELVWRLSGSGDNGTVSATPLDADWERLSSQIHRTWSRVEEATRDVLSRQGAALVQHGERVTEALEDQGRKLGDAGQRIARTEEAFLELAQGFREELVPVLKSVLEGAREGATASREILESQQRLQAEFAALVREGGFGAVLGRLDETAARLAGRRRWWPLLGRRA